MILKTEIIKNIKDIKLISQIPLNPYPYFLYRRQFLSNHNMFFKPKVPDILGRLINSIGYYERFLLKYSLSKYRSRYMMYFINGFKSIYGDLVIEINLNRSFKKLICNNENLDFEAGIKASKCFIKYSTIDSEDYGFRIRKYINIKFTARMIINRTINKYISFCKDLLVGDDASGKEKI